MKKTFTVLFLGGGLSLVLFSSCTTGIASSGSGGNRLAAHSAVEDANDSLNSPDTFGNPLVEY